MTHEEKSFEACTWFYRGMLAALGGLPKPLPCLEYDKSSLLIETENWQLLLSRTIEHEYLIRIITIRDDGSNSLGHEEVRTVQEALYQLDNRPAPLSTSERVKKVILIDSQIAMYRRYIQLIEVAIELEQHEKIPGYLRELDHIHQGVCFNVCDSNEWCLCNYNHVEA